MTETQPDQIEERPNEWIRQVGHLVVLALDHRDSFRVFVNPDDPDSVSKDLIRDIKRDLVANCSWRVDGFMLDPEVGMDPKIVKAAGDKLIIAALEAQGYLMDPSVTHTTLMADWNPALAKQAGAHWVKLLVLWDGKPNAEQEKTIELAVSAAQDEEMELVLEPLARSADLGDDWLFDWVSRYHDWGATFLKLPYPGSQEKCLEISRMSSCPWVLLSGGVEFEEFYHQLHTAVERGVCGYIAGRTLWGEAISADKSERRHLIEDRVLSKIDALSYHLSRRFG